MPRTRKPQPETSSYVYAGKHVGDLADGRILEPGGHYDLDGPAVADPHNTALINAGLLFPADPQED